MEIIIDDMLKLRPWQEDDKAELQRIANNLNVSRNLREIFPHPYTLSDAEEWVTLNIMGCVKRISALNSGVSLQAGSVSSYRKIFTASRRSSVTGSEKSSGEKVS